MTQAELDKILAKHEKWLNDKDGGERANLRGANLQYANLQDADLRRANLQNANLQDADLRRANLQNANLRGANLQDASLQNANLQYANLQNANLQNANLRRANINFCSWPIWCGSLKVHIDDNIGLQLLYHAVSPILYSKYTSKWLKRVVSGLVSVVNMFIKVKTGEVDKLEPFKE